MKSWSAAAASPRRPKSGNGWRLEVARARGDSSLRELRMNKTAVLALDLSPAAEPLLECAAELRRWGVGRLLVVDVVRMHYGQEPGDRALQEIREWLEARADRLRSAELRVDVDVRAARSPADG